MKLWGGRFQKDTDLLVNELNASISFDQRLYREDITGSMAHAAMLADCGIISKEDAAAITSGLEDILADIEAGKAAFTADNEDIHMNVEALLTAQNVLNCNACIALPQVEDETLTLASLRFHQRLGYTPAGQFHQCGYKFGRWYHMVWMEKFLGAHSLPPAPFLPFPQLGERTAGLLAPWATAAVW